MRREIRAVVTVFAVLIVSAIWSAAQLVTPQTFWVENAELDMGQVVAGTTATATFVFHNDGPGEVNIIRAKPS